MTTEQEPAKFLPCIDVVCDVVGVHFHGDSWGDYWRSLSREQQQSVRDKARWEGMSLSAVATVYGAVR